jgi:hypothetical protein
VLGGRDTRVAELEQPYLPGNRRFALLSGSRVADIGSFDDDAVR